MSAKSEFMKKWMRNLDAAHAAESSRKSPAGIPQSAGTGIEARDILGVPHLGAFADMDYFYLLSPLVWRPRSAGSSAQAVEVPRGFVTDLASVPGLFWSIASPQGRHGVAAIIHDWLYWHQDRTRDEADLAFYQIMTDLKVSAVKRWIFYYAVRLRAGGYWDEYALAKSSGRLEPRILKRFPEHADVSWDDWRKDSGVFT